MKIKHDGDLLILNDNIGLNVEGCKELAKLLISSEIKRNELSFKLRSRAALIESTNGKIWSEENGRNTTGKLEK